MTASTSLSPPPWEFRLEDDDAVRVGYFGRFATSPVMCMNRADVIVEVADFLQDKVVEDLYGPWPVCREHDKGTYAQLVDLTPVWFCRFGGHTVGEIGRLSG